MRAVGGASANALWMQIKADVTGCPIRAVADPDATSLGCAMLAALGCGLIQPADCARFVELAETAYMPNPANKAIYDKRFDQYKHLYATLEGTMKGWDE
jgi:xylulokinase